MDSPVLVVSPSRNRSLFTMSSSAKRRWDLASEMDEDPSDSEQRLPARKRLSTRPTVEDPKQLPHNFPESPSHLPVLAHGDRRRTPTPEASSVPSDSGLGASPSESPAQFLNASDNDELMDVSVYNPEYDESRNPFYFSSNRVLYEAHLERMRRGKDF
ncbi:uncharacterized protein LOC129590228 [Paramacrobiotus metropolitanus]|uniref:uncharacterized protein LOC129590228 n=1 Tax=Paramacrobiotus metropolitanus TaxID=2943436 RepID=UPI00244593E7|nr:uncharacterized protein LOC129590228 [Paramacrobiotus metropolitanus]